MGINTCTRFLRLPQRINLARFQALTHSSQLPSLSLSIPRRRWTSLQGSWLSKTGALLPYYLIVCAPYYLIVCATDLFICAAERHGERRRRLDRDDSCPSGRLVSNKHYSLAVAYPGEDLQARGWRAPQGRRPPGGAHGPVHGHRERFFVVSTAASAAGNGEYTYARDGGTPAATRWICHDGFSV